MSLLGSSPEACDYIKTLEYAVFDEQAMEVVMGYCNEQIKTRLNQVCLNFICIINEKLCNIIVFLQKIIMCIKI